MIRILKSAVLVLILLNAAIINLSLTPKEAYALSDIDQTCQSGASPQQYTFLSHEPVQVFVPTKNRLEAVQVYIKTEIGTEANVRMEIKSENHGVIAARTERITNQWGWQKFDFPNIEMPMDIYGIALTDSGDLGKAVWMKGPANCYDRGYAIEDNAAHMEFDFRFGINAFNAEDSSNPPSGSQSAPSDPGTSSSSNSTGTTRGSGSIPASNTSSSLGAPSNLVATNESNYTGTGIRLNWTASSSSSIDGYKIFRSNSQTGGFTEIARIIKGLTLYLDSNIVSDQTYYYFARAYKGNQESASSNVATATAKDTFKDDILNDYKNNSGGLFSGLLGGGFLLMMIIPAIIGFIIFVLIVIGIILLVRRKNTNQTKDTPAPDVSVKSSEKDKPTK